MSKEVVEYKINQVAIPDIPIEGADSIIDKESFFHHALQYSYKLEHADDPLKSKVCAQVINHIFKIKKMMYEDEKNTRYTFTLNQFIQFYHFCDNIFKSNGSWQKNDVRRVYSTSLQCSCNYSAKRAMVRLGIQTDNNDDDDDDVQIDEDDEEHTVDVDDIGDVDIEDQDAIDRALSISHRPSHDGGYNASRKTTNKKTTFFKCPVRYSLVLNFENPESPIVTLVTRSGPHTHPLTDFEKRFTSKFHDSLARAIIPQGGSSIALVCKKMKDELEYLSMKYDIELDSNVPIIASKVRNIIKGSRFGDISSASNERIARKLGLKRKMQKIGEFESIAVWKVDEPIAEPLHNDPAGHGFNQNQRREYDEYKDRCIVEMEKIFERYKNLAKSIKVDRNCEENCKKLKSNLDSFVIDAEIASQSGTQGRL